MSQTREEAGFFYELLRIFSIIADLFRKMTVYIHSGNYLSKVFKRNFSIHVEMM